MNSNQDGVTNKQIKDIFRQEIKNLKPILKLFLVLNLTFVFTKFKTSKLKGLN